MARKNENPLTPIALIIAFAALAAVVIASVRNAFGCELTSAPAVPVEYRLCGEIRGGGPPPEPTTAAVDTAVADLAVRLGVDPSAITVESVEAVTWRDGSLGCPEPGRAYALVLRPGQRIVLVVDDVQYHYHSDGGPTAFYCRIPAPAVGE